MIKIIDIKDSFDFSEPTVLLCSFDEIKSFSNRLNIDYNFLDRMSDKKISNFESYENFDYISLNIVNVKNPLEKKKHVCFFIFKHMLVIVCNNKEEILRHLETRIKKDSIFDALQAFFNTMVEDDLYFLEKFQDEIALLEKKILNGKEENVINDIIIYRKKIMQLKKYYQQLYILADNLIENDNQIVAPKALRYFKTFKTKISLLNSECENLSDYITQVRDAYQAQVDIGLNDVMKLFTVLTAIFMPLTLIAGWYGMNFNMPEYAYKYSYYVVIFISLVIVLALVYYFKKNKWF